MSPFWDWFSLLAGTAAHLVTNYFGDILSSRKMTDLGIKEQFWLASGSGGAFVEWKGWLLKLIPVATVWPTFLLFSETDHYDRFWCGFMFIPWIVVSVAMYFHNWKKIKNRIERNRRMSGGII